MSTFSVTFLLLVFSISAIFPAEGENCWCKKNKAKPNEKKVILEFEPLLDKLEEALKNKEFLDFAAKSKFIQKTLDVLSSGIQKPVQELLDILNIPWVSYWISNVITIDESDYEEIKSKLKPFKIIKDARPELVMSMSDDDVAINNQETVVEAANHTLDCPPQKNSLTWGLDKLQVREAWKIAKGNGIVVGSIDSGVLPTHIAIKEKYLNSERSWYDAVRGFDRPIDLTGHGTHTIGTMVGDFGIGVAPGAKFIACLAGGVGSWRESNILKCGQFMLCPTKPNGKDQDCSQAPRVVNNSWGYRKPWGSSKTFLSMIQTWIKADIVPVFCIGNEGPKCNTTRNPGHLPEAIGVGASDSNDVIAFFSSRGPAPANAKIPKPDVTAPGVRVCSASFRGKAEYKLDDGTSMAAPHISGIIALMLSVNPKRKTTVQEVKNILYSSKVLKTDGLKTNDGKWTCNEGLPANKPNKPRHDNYFGRGIPNALKAVEETQHYFKKQPKPK